MKKLCIITIFVFHLLFPFVNIFAQYIFCVQDEWATGRYNFVDSQNRVLFSGNFRLIDQFSEGMGIIQFDDINQTQAYIDSQGNVIRPQLPSGFTGHVILYPFSHDYALITTGDTVRYVSRQFFVNKRGEIVSEIFYRANSFSEGIAVVQSNRGTTYRAIDTNFRTLFEIRSADHNKDENTWKFKSGLLPVMNIREEWGYIDKTGQLIIQPNRQFGADFSGDYAISRSDTFVFNKSGETVYTIEPKTNLMRRVIRYPYIFNGKLIILDLDVTIVDLVDRSKQDIVFRIPNQAISPLFRFHAHFLGEYFIVFNGIFNFSGERIATMPNSDVYYPDSINKIWYNRFWVGNNRFYDLLEIINQ